MATQNPIEIPLKSTIAFLESFVPRSPATILDVGSGTGELTLKLTESGHRVIGVESSEKHACASHQLGLDVRHVDFLDFKDGLYDVVLFSRSLHHIYPSMSAVRQAHSLLLPDGVVIVDDFDVDSADTATARWFFRIRAVLAASGMERMPLPTGPMGPYESWRAEHQHEPPLNSGSMMIASLEQLFEIVHLERSPYLYRYFSYRLPSTDEGYSLALRLLKTEERLIQSGTIRPTGLRIVGRKK
jgi:SAM-dependent methyltransferase